MTWVKIDGYHQEHRCVDDTGRIIAKVSGSEYEHPQEWIANDTRGGAYVFIGRYENLASAKRATQRFLCKAMRRSGKP